MKNLIISIIIFLIPIIGFSAENTSNRITIVVEKYLKEKIEDSLSTYIQDLKNEGYEPILKEWSLQEQKTPSELRNYLKGVYNESGGLQGVVFIGDLPVAIFETPSDFSDYQGPYPTDHYYMDLEGPEWEDRNNNGYLDWPEFTAENSANLMVWISRIKVPQSWGTLNDKVALIEDYFKKNHEFRTGGRLYNERNWTYITNEWIEAIKNVNIYNIYTAWNVKTNFFTNDLPKAVFLELLTDNTNELGLAETHGDKNELWVNAAGETITSEELKTLGVQTPFLIILACWVGDYTALDYFSGALLFSNKSAVQAVIAATIPIATWRMDVFSYPFENGSNFGKSYLKYLMSNNDWNKSTLANERGRVILGDGTLKRQRYILGENNIKVQESLLKPTEVLTYIMPTSVLPIINTLRFSFPKKAIYWDKYFMNNDLTYRLSKKGEDEQESIIYEGTDNKVFDTKLNKGDTYDLEYIWKEPKGAVTSRKAEVKAEIQDAAMDYVIRSKYATLEQYLSSLRDPEEKHAESTQLLEWARDNDIDKFKSWLDSIDINKENEGNNPIIYDLVGNNEMLKIALKAGADPNISKIGNPDDLPIFLAIYNNQLESLTLLLANGANSKIFHGSFGDTPFQVIAANRPEDWKGMMDVLLATDIDIDQKNKYNGATALIFAVEENHLDIVKYLIEHGANLDIKDNEGVSALDFAQASDNPAIKELLIQAGAKENTG